MKKFKILKPLMALPVAATPLCVLSSCGGDDFIELATKLKEETINLFTEQICPLHRATYDCGEAAGFIREYLSNLEGVTLAGYDEWSKIDEVKTVGMEALTTETYDESWDGVLFSDKTIRGGGKTYGNMWYDIPASNPDHELDPPLTLQSHYDMGLEFADKKAWDDWAEIATLDDPHKGGVKPVNDPENEILRAAEKTTPLGADNGLGIALMLVFAKHQKEFHHGKIRLLFTVDEQASTSDISAGADLLRYDQLYGQYPATGKYQSRSLAADGETRAYPFGENYEYSNILSLNGIVKGLIYSSSAGIHDCLMATQNDTLGTDDLTPIGDGTPGIGTNKNPIYKIKVSGLHGGHSSEDINKGYANALQILMSVLADSSVDDMDNEKYGFHILDIGVPQNAYSIPKDATAFITSNAHIAGHDELTTDAILQAKVDAFQSMYRSAYPNDPGITVTLTKSTEDSPFTDPEDTIVTDRIQNTGYVLNTVRSEELCEFFSLLKYGPLTFFPGTKQTEVLTSQNFGPLSVTLSKDSGNQPHCNISFHIVIRSASEVEREIFSYYAHAYAVKVLNWITKTKDIYDMELPIWEYNKDDKLMLLSEEAYNRLGYRPDVTNLHGWAEIACIPRIYEEAKLEWKPFISCFGPTITEGHTLMESVWTDTMMSWIRCALYVMDNAFQLIRTPQK